MTFFKVDSKIINQKSFRSDVVFSKYLSFMLLATQQSNDDDGQDFTHGFKSCSQKIFSKKLNTNTFGVGALMKHFLEGIAPLRHWYIHPNEKSNKYKSSLLN